MCGQITHYTRRDTTRLGWSQLVPGGTLSSHTLRTGGGCSRADALVDEFVRARMKGEVPLLQSAHGDEGEGEAAPQHTEGSDDDEAAAGARACDEGIKRGRDDHGLGSTQSQSQEGSRSRKKRRRRSES